MRGDNDRPSVLTFVALVVFAVAGLTDALDGLIARRFGLGTTLGAWLDPMADKLLLVSTFVVLTWPGLGLANRLPIWLTVLIISRDVVIVLTVAVVNLAIGPRVFRPSLFGKVATATYIVTAVVAMFFGTPLAPYLIGPTMVARWD